MRIPAIQVEEVTVWKTGLPFYDAARLIGAAHQRFGTASVEVEDQGSRWLLRGPRLRREREAPQLGWVLEDLPTFAASVNALKRDVGQLLGRAGGPPVTESQEEPRRRRGRPRKDTMSVYYYLESALQTGTRGPDPLASYRNLASQAGVDFPQPQEEVAWLALGTSFAAVSRGGGESGERRVLPVLAGDRMVLGPFMDFRRTYYHQAGSFVAAVWASLAILEDLVAQDLPVADFAYNWVEPRVQSSSGFLGLHRVCTLVRARLREGRGAEFIGQVRSYLRNTRGAQGGFEQDLARALAHFVSTASVKHLEAVVRLKARLMAGEQGWARRQAEGLFRNVNSVKEVSELVGQQVAVPEGLSWALAEWFTKGGRDGWIGQFIKLENASSPAGFLDQVERILSRARMHRDEDQRVVYRATRGETEILQQVRDMSLPQFRGFRAVFLLDVQAKMTWRAREEQRAEEATQ